VDGFLINPYQFTAAVPPGPLAGYITGGFSGSFLASIEKLTFSTEALLTISATLSAAAQGTCGFESDTHGYAAGGSNSGGWISTVDKIKFSDDSKTTLGTGLSQNVDFCAGFSSSTHGYRAGGRSSASGFSGVINKFAFSDDTRTTPAATISPARFGAAGFNSSTTLRRARDAFIPPRPFPSWVLNEDTCLWDAPVPYPQDGKMYQWSEDDQLWLAVEV
jgi:hypothetical protein